MDILFCCLNFQYSVLYVYHIYFIFIIYIFIIYLLNIYIDFDVENNDKDAKFEVGDHVRVSKYKNIFALGCTPNCSGEVFVIKEVEKAVTCTYVIENLNDEEIFGALYEKELRKTKTAIKLYLK